MGNLTLPRSARWRCGLFWRLGDCPERRAKAAAYSLEAFAARMMPHRARETKCGTRSLRWPASESRSANQRDSVVRARLAVLAGRVSLLLGTSAESTHICVTDPFRPPATIARFPPHWPHFRRPPKRDLVVSDRGSRGMRLGVLGLFETLKSAVYLFPQNLIDNTKFLTPLDTPLTL
jgi:hypothetical protein